MNVTVDLVEGEPVGLHLPRASRLRWWSRSGGEGQTRRRRTSRRSCRTGEDHGAPFIEAGERIVVKTRTPATWSARRAEARAMAFRLPTLTVMANAAQKASKRLLRDFNEVEQLQVCEGPSDFVSQADIRAEQTLREELNKARPGYAFLMEESGASGPTTGVALGGRSTGWDDEFPARHSALGDQHRAGAADRGGEVELAAGLIYAPASDEMFWAEKGGGAFVNEKRLRVSARRELSSALFATGIPSRGGTGAAAGVCAHAGALMPQVAG